MNQINPVIIKESRKQPILFVIAMGIFILAVLCGWIKLHYGFNFMDEGYHMTESWRLAAGDHFLNDKITGALIHYTLINSIIFKLFPSITLLDFRVLQYFMTIILLILFSITLYRVHREYWILPLLFSVFAFTGLDAIGMIPNLYYQTYPHFLLTLFLVLFINGLLQKSPKARAVLFLTSGACIWVMSLSTLHTSTILLTPLIFYLLINRFYSKRYSFYLHEMLLILLPFFLGWGFFLINYGQKYFINLFNSVQLTLSLPTHSKNALININWDNIILVSIYSAIIIGLKYLLEKSRTLVAISGLFLISLFIFWSIRTSFGGVFQKGIYSYPYFSSCLMASFLVIFWFSVIYKLFKRQDLNRIDEFGFILLVPTSILCFTTSILSSLGIMTVLHSSIPIIGFIGFYFLKTNLFKNYSVTIKFLILGILLFPLYSNIIWFDWKFTFYDVSPSKATTIIDHGFGKGINTNNTYNSLYNWIDKTTQLYSKDNDYIISYVLGPMTHMIAKRKPSLEDTFIDFSRPKEYYEKSINLMKQHKREPKLAFKFDRIIGLIPISLQEQTFSWFPVQLSEKTQDPISSYIRNNMYLLDQFQVEQGFVVQCFVDNPIDPAIAQLTKKLQHYSSDADLFLQLGNLYARKNDHTLAIEAFKKSLSLNPHSLAALNQLARSYAQIERFDDAIEALQKIVDIQDDKSDVYYNLACIYSKLRKIDDSLRVLNRAVALGFKDCNLMNEDPDLDNIRETAQFREIVQGSCSPQE